MTDLMRGMVVAVLLAALLSPVGPMVTPATSSVVVDVGSDGVVSDEGDAGDEGGGDDGSEGDGE